MATNLLSDPVVGFEDEPFIRTDADDQVHWVDTSKIAHDWIHEEL